MPSKEIVGGDVDVDGVGGDGEDVVMHQIVVLVIGPAGVLVVINVVFQVYRHEQETSVGQKVVAEDVRKVLRKQERATEINVAIEDGHGGADVSAIVVGQEHVAT